ncbi:sensor histidine kinase [Naasia sp. SYSU D00948]|uniref:sensor histidine kinase n=1 Tax=Naasia sp. SYSU D00948 TaxID=2817379 RepID=UPI001B3018AF|nr:ATP-binding protein [Naasia sp. SYSU D00948]
MSLGLPGHLAPRAVSAGLARASHVIAGVCLLAAFAATLSQQVAAPSRVIWPAALVLLPILALLVAVDRNRSLLRVCAYLVVGAALSYLYASILLVQVPIITTSGSWVFTLLKVSLVMVGAVGARTAGAVVPPAAGWVLAEASIGLAALGTGKPVVLDVTAGLAVALVVIAAVGMAMTRPRARSVQPALHRAARDEHLAALRSAAEARAAALLHDTVLSDLAAIAASEGPLRPALADQLRRDLEMIIGQDWSESVPHGAVGSGEWAGSSIARSVEEGRALGLDVTVSGDPASVSTLSAAADETVGLAVRQLLVNVHRHAGVDSAEVVVYPGAGMVSVMVIDAGRGFDERETGRDRFGLRTSVRSRVESIGGRVQVWSAPGRGTSVLLQVPQASAARQDLVVGTGDAA